MSDIEKSMIFETNTFLQLFGIYKDGDSSCENDKGQSLQVEESDLSSHFNHKNIWFWDPVVFPNLAKAIIKGPLSKGLGESPRSRVLW